MVIQGPWQELRGGVRAPARAGVQVVAREFWHQLAHAGDAGGAAGCVHAQYKFYAYLRPENLAAGWSRDRIIHEMNAAGVPCFQGSCSEVYLEKAFDGTGWRPEHRLPVAKELGETSVMWLVHPTLTEAEMQKTAQVIASVLTAARK